MLLRQSPGKFFNGRLKVTLLVPLVLRKQEKDFGKAKVSTEGVD